MTVRAKFEVVKVAELGYNGKRSEVMKLVKGDGEAAGSRVERWECTGVPIREITMSAVLGGSAENQSFATSTPSGTITFQLNNPALADEFKPGQSYYVEFTPAGE